MVTMYIVAVVGLFWIALTLFRHAGASDFVVRLPAFFLLAFFWGVSVMFGGLLLEAFIETVSN